MQMKTVLPLATASEIVDEALAVGRNESMHPLTVVVLDMGGKLIAAKSEDGSGNLRFEIAFGKASAALGMGISSRLIRDRLANRPAFQSAIASASDGKFIPVPGGVLIEDAEGFTIGAVGISGDTSEKDEYCAIKAVHKAGFATEPADIDPDWTRSYLSDQDKPES
ncbi:MAG: heme-binding protein [Lentilitoribacter sp.]